MLFNIEKIGNRPNDSAKTIIQKAFLVYLALFMGLGGVLWGTISLYFNLTIPALIPYSYTILTAINLLFFAATKNFSFTKFFQVFISLVLPFLFQWALGGYLSSGVIMLWAILAVISSLTFYKVSNAIVWLVFYIILAVFSGVYEDYFQTLKPEILPNTAILFYILNITIISTIVFGLMAYFTKSNENSRTLLEENQEKLHETNMKIRNLLTEKSKANEIITKNNADLKVVMKELENKEQALLDITKKQTELYDKLLKNDSLENNL